jgi:ribosome-associated protein
VDADRIRITPTVSIAAQELSWRTMRSGGPGGQHANTSETRVEVTFDVRRSLSLTAPQRSLVASRIGPVVRAVAADTRSQARNRELAQARLVSRLGAALRAERARRPTSATRSSKERRLRAKQRRGTTKQLRRRPPRDGDD